MLTGLRSVSSDVGRLHPVIDVLARCRRQGIRICVLRDADHIEDARGGEVDLLVDESRLDDLRRVFRKGGFIELAAWGYAPHHFFVLYEAAVDRWIKCDVVTALVYGGPATVMCDGLAAQCLQRSRIVNGVPVLSVEDELFTLLMHELLDKGGVRAHRRQRLKQLCGALSKPERLDAMLASYWPSLTRYRMVDAIVHDGWHVLWARSAEMRVGRSRRARLRSQLAAARNRAARMAGRVVGVIRPQAPSVSLLAPDGAGKSTLIHDIQANFFGAAFAMYMGLYQQGAARRPVSVRGLRLVRLVLTQWRRYLTARRRQASGQLVLFDRYTYDAWLGGPKRTGLVSTIRRAILARACPAPDLIVILDAPSRVLYARKPEHSLELLEQQRLGYRDVLRRVPRVVVVDADRPLADVRRSVMTLVWDRYCNGRHAPAPAPAKG